MPKQTKSGLVKVSTYLGREPYRQLKIKLLSDPQGMCVAEWLRARISEYLKKGV